MKTSSFISLILTVCVLGGLQAFACPPTSGANNSNNETPAPNSQAGTGGQSGSAGSPSAPAPASGSVTVANTTPPNTADAAQAAAAPAATSRAAKATRDKAEADVKTAPYVDKMWSCGCSNFHKICDKGFVFTSMADATAYAKHQCGNTCIPECTGHPR